MNDESLLIRATAFHEAGHAAFVLGSPHAETLVSVRISADVPFQKWGEVETNVKGGDIVWPSDRHMEFGRCLAGPLAEVLFVGESFDERLRGSFDSGILRAIGERGLFSETRNLGWWSDLEYFVSSLESNLQQEGASFGGLLAFEDEVGQPLYGAHLDNEARLRKWIEREPIRAFIQEVAQQLIETRRLDSYQCREILRGYPDVTGSVQEAGFTEGD